MASTDSKRCPDDCAPVAKRLKFEVCFQEPSTPASRETPCAANVECPSAPLKPSFGMRRAHARAQVRRSIIVQLATAQPRPQPAQQPGAAHQPRAVDCT